jgi:hypothetical protein
MYTPRAAAITNKIDKLMTKRFAMVVFQFEVSPAGFCDRLCTDWLMNTNIEHGGPATIKPPDRTRSTWDKVFWNPARLNKSHIEEMCASAATHLWPRSSICRVISPTPQNMSSASKSRG